MERVGQLASFWPVDLRAGVRHTRCYLASMRMVSRIVMSVACLWVSTGCGGASAPAVDASVTDGSTTEAGDAGSTPTQPGDASGSTDASPNPSVDGSASPVDSGDATALNDGLSAEDAPPADGGPNPDACQSISPPYPSRGYSPATVTVTGDALSAATCPNGAYAYVEAAEGSTATSPYFLFMSYTLSEGAPQGPDFVFASPSDALDGQVDVMIGLASASPGQYSSPAGYSCGSVVFDYSLPIPAGLTCDGGSPPSCPPSCLSVCSGFGCEPCTSEQPEVLYLAKGSTDCLGNSQTATGSWALSLTSVEPNDGGASSGGSYFLAHGSLTATLLGGPDSGTVPADFSVSF